MVGALSEIVLIPRSSESLICPNGDLKLLGQKNNHLIQAISGTYSVFNSHREKDCSQKNGGLDCLKALTERFRAIKRSPAMTNLVLIKGNIL